MCLKTSESSQLEAKLFLFFFKKKSKLLESLVNVDPEKSFQPNYNISENKIIDLVAWLRSSEILKTSSLFFALFLFANIYIDAMAQLLAISVEWDKTNSRTAEGDMRFVALVKKERSLPSVYPAFICFSLQISKYLDKK